VRELPVYHVFVAMRHDSVSAESLAAVSSIDTRQRAAQLLCHVLLCLEENITQDAHTLVAALVGGIHDYGDCSGHSCPLLSLKLPDATPSNSISKHIVIASRLMGRFLQPRVYIESVLMYVRGEQTTSRKRLTDQSHSRDVASSLHVLLLALDAAPAARKPSAAPPILIQLLSTSVRTLIDQAIKLLVTAGPENGQRNDVMVAFSLTRHFLMLTLMVVSHCPQSTFEDRRINMFVHLLGLRGLLVTAPALARNRASMVVESCVDQRCEKRRGIHRTTLGLVDDALLMCSPTPVPVYPALGAEQTAGLSAPTDSFSLMPASIALIIQQHFEPLITMCLAEFPEVLEWSWMHPKQV
jgi:hypothetical protein